ncbi:uncharacterized protein E0L32_005066 [Thyridium curvatum]|uniref:Uncharacterized protein n=1 Tax=Thyridium curvatum TaxID=1093900 RepID=A0A507BCI9_9PEZI|nr:uncharacterized protein E0L32_005066 [Thyridium curvatum]TPX14671.1 hypothetical protein E0L32_005066 [Thyridium curvatum]
MHCHHCCIPAPGETSDIHISKNPLASQLHEDPTLPVGFDGPRSSIGNAGQLEASASGTPIPLSDSVSRSRAGSPASLRRRIGKHHWFRHVRKHRTPRLLHVTETSDSHGSQEDDKESQDQAAEGSGEGYVPDMDLGDKSREDLQGATDDTDEASESASLTPVRAVTPETSSAPRVSRMRRAKLPSSEDSNATSHVPEMAPYKHPERLLREPDEPQKRLTRPVVPPNTPKTPSRMTGSSAAVPLGKTPDSPVRLAPAVPPNTPAGRDIVGTHAPLHRVEHHLDLRTAAMAEGLPNGPRPSTDSAGQIDHSDRAETNNNDGTPPQGRTAERPRQSTRNKTHRQVSFDEKQVTAAELNRLTRLVDKALQVVEGTDSPVSSAGSCKDFGFINPRELRCPLRSPPPPGGMASIFPPPTLGARPTVKSTSSSPLPQPVPDGKPPADATQDPSRSQSIAESRQPVLLDELTESPEAMSSGASSTTVDSRSCGEKSSTASGADDVGRRPGQRSSSGTIQVLESLAEASASDSDSFVTCRSNLSGEDKGGVK